MGCFMSKRYHDNTESRTAYYCLRFKKRNCKIKNDK